MGNFNPGGPPAGRFTQTITLRTAPANGPLPLSAGRQRASAITISRLAVPMPAFLPSVNQIGFDSYDWIASTISRTRSGVLLWVIGAYRDARGIERVDPHSAFSFPLHGAYQGAAVSLSSPSVALQFSFGKVPLRRFELRGSLGPGLAFRPGAALYAETVCATVPIYGPELAFTGICNPHGVLAASGTFLSAAYRGPAASRPAGVRITVLSLAHPSLGHPGSLTASLAGRRLPSAASHVAGLLITDASTGDPVSLDYNAERSQVKDRRGRIAAIGLTLPAGTALPARIRVYVIIDAFPLASRVL